MYCRSEHTDTKVAQGMLDDQGCQTGWGFRVEWGQLWLKLVRLESRNMDIAHRGVLMNLRCEAVFTAEIGQYSGIELSSRRSQIMRLCYLTPSLFKYLHKTPYYREMLDRNIESEISLMSLPGKWLRNQGNFRPTREMIENILYVWFSHFTFTEAHRC